MRKISVSELRGKCFFVLMLSSNAALQTNCAGCLAQANFSIDLEFLLLLNSWSYITFIAPVSLMPSGEREIARPLVRIV